MTSVRAMTLGMLFCLAYGCELDQSLGDLRDGGSGSAGDSGTGGSDSATGGTETGGAGNSASGGSASGGSVNGGAGNSSSGGSANGGSANGGSSAGGTSPNGGSSAGGTSPNGGTGSGGECFTPDVNPPLTIGSGAVGCACDESEPDQCIVVSETPRLRAIAMICGDGRWQTGEDGACAPESPDSPTRQCMIENRLISNEREVPQRLLCEFCAWCGIGGSVCALIDCPPITCPAGTERVSRCRQCGPGGGCVIEEHGCFEPCEEGELCEFGRCSDGVCSAGPCI